MLDGVNGTLPQDLTDTLESADIYIIPDLDKVGKEFATKIANLLTKSNTVKILDLTKKWENLKEKGDITDVFEMVVGDNSYNPEDMMINYETETEIIEKAHNLLTDLEKQVFDLKISGFNYKEIAEILEKDPKTIDNAIQRLKQKMKKAISDK